MGRDMIKGKLKLKPLFKKKIEYGNCKSCKGFTPVSELRHEYCPTCIYWDGIMRRNEEFISMIGANKKV
jgi:hypothetical protein